MTVGTAGFIGERLKQAREARALTLVALADLVGLSSAAISHYEKKEHSPRPEQLQTIADKLNLPVSYFLKPNPVSRESARLFWRSMSAATKQARVRATRRYEWLVEIVDYLSGFFEFPAANIPDFGLPKDFRTITWLTIETIAQQTRDEWRLGRGPIADVIRVLEANGCIVSAASLGSDYLDAFSEFDTKNRPFVFLGTDKNILVRSRYDAAHELGHVILHRHVDKKSLSKASDFKLIEDQANYFANAFLLPATEFIEELWSPSLDGFRALKPRWNVSIAAMIYRTKSLKIISEDEAKRLWINLNRRGWRQFEPLDDLPAERPQTLAKCFRQLIDSRVCTREQIANDIRLSTKDIEELAGLPMGFLSGDIKDVENEPKLKRIREGNVFEFRRLKE